MKILLADDHNVLRKGLRRILEEQPDLEVVGEASDGRQAVQLTQTTKPDIVVMDIAMPLMNGLEATRQILQRNPSVNVLILSMYSDETYIVQVLRAGARGYLLKDSPAGDLVTAVRSVASGESYLSPAVSNAVLDDYRRHVTNPIDLLTTREREVLQMLAEGKTNKEIAVVLKLSVYTVDAHRGRIMEKLNLHSINELVRFAVRNGLID